MSDPRSCPKCGGRMKFGRCKKREAFTERRRDCPKCGHGDKVHVRIQEEILAIIEVVRRSKRVVRKRTQKSTQAKKSRNTESKKGQSC